MKRSLLSFHIGFTEHPEPIIGSYVVYLNQAGSQMNSLFSTPEPRLIPNSKVYVTTDVYAAMVNDDYKQLLQICDEQFPLNNRSK